MPKIITPAVLDATFQGFNTLFNDALKGATPTWNKIAMEVPSSGSAENYGWLGQFPRFREWIGDRVYMGLNAYGHTIVNKPFESTIAVKREQIEDDQLGIFSPMFSEMGRSTALFPDELVFPLLPAGFTTLCYDGQYFFDVDHPVLDANGVAQSVSNSGGGSGTAWYLLDASRAIKPLIYQSRKKPEFVARTDPRTSDRVFDRAEFAYGTDLRANGGFGLWQLMYASKQTLNSANLRIAIQAMKALKGDYGRPLALTPTLLVVGSSLDATARDLLWAEKLANGASNTDFKIVDLFISPWLD